MRSRVLACVLIASTAVASALADEPTRKLRIRAVTPSDGLPAAMTHPEGMTRWDLTSLPGGRSVMRSIFEAAGAVRVEDVASSATSSPAAITTFAPAASEPTAPARFVLPDRAAALRIGTRDAVDLLRDAGSGPEDVRVESEIVGIGWVELPSGPREVVLQRALVLVRPRGSDALEPETLLHRWIDPRAGVVAEVGGTPSTDGRSRLDLDSAWAVDAVIAGAADLRIYVDQLYGPNHKDVNYGWDRGIVAIASLTPDGFTTAGDLINKPSAYWDFSANTTGKEVIQIDVPVNVGETCNYNQCGFNVPGGQLGRQDKFSGTTLDRKDNQVTTQENRAGDVTIWVWAGAQKEGKSGLFGTGESRYCYRTEGSTVRTPVPLWRFSHNDAGRWYMTAGDSWANATPFACEQNLYNTICGSGSGQLFPTLWAQACGDHAGTQSGTVIRGGVVKIPSGHTLNALLIRTLADFCVFSGSACSIFQKLSEVRTVVYLWQVPIIGTVALIQSEQNAPDVLSWTQTENTIIGFGLYPPLSITVTGQTDTTVSLSWNPGNQVQRIDGYMIYWDTDPGAATPYAFNSDTHASQVAFAGATATVSGLAPGTTYYFTVTSRSTYVDPGNSSSSSDDTARTYESIKYPTQVSSDQSTIYPVEVQAATSPNRPPPVPDGRTGLPIRASRASPDGTTIDLTWDVATCTGADYHVLRGSLANLRNLASYQVDGARCDLGTTGSATWSGVPAGDLWFVIVADDGATVEGSWGKNSIGVERGGSTASGFCSMTSRDNAGTCP